MVSDADWRLADRFVEVNMIAIVKAKGTASMFFRPSRIFVPGADRRP